MFPIADDNTDRRSTPVVNYVLIALNVLVFMVFQGMGENQAFTYGWAAVPEEILTRQDIITSESVERAEQQARLGWSAGERQRGLSLQDIVGPPRPSLAVYLTLLTCTFLHGSLMHLGGNMLYLWIFGDNLEDELGHLRYLCFYLLTGVLATLTHVLGVLFLPADPLVPLVGASGAIAGVLGGYILLHPFRRVRMFVLRILVDVPAWVAIGLWFGLQIISVLNQYGGGGEAGVAYLAHIGGFIAGVVLVKIFHLGVPKREAWGGSY